MKALLIPLIFTIFHFVTANVTTAAEVGSIAFKNITVENGLSDKTVMSVYQDHIGYLWIGTRDGLHRYDGEKLLVYKSTPFSKQTLAASYISSITESKDGKLWIGTDGGGVNVFNPSDETFRVVGDKAEDLTNDSKRAWKVLRTSKNRFLVATLGGGLSLFAEDFKEIAHFKHDPSNPNSISSDYIEALAETPSGDFLLGTDGQGLNQLIQESGGVKQFVHDPDDPYSLPNDDVTEILVTTQQKVWVGTDGSGLARLDLESGKFFGFDLVDQLGNPVNSVTALAEGEDNVIWVGTWNQGLFKIELSSQRVTHFIHDSSRENSLVDNRIWDLFVDKSNNLLIGTHFGLSILPANKKIFSSYPLQVKDKSRILAIASRTNGEVFVGTDGLGLFSASASEQLNLRKNKMVDINSISALMFDDKQNLWLGSYTEGLFHWDNEKHYQAKLDLNDQLQVERINSIFQDSNRRVWIATSGDGVFRYSSSAELLERPLRYAENKGITNLNISTIYQDSQGRIWIGSYGGGLYLFDEKEDNFSNITHDNQNRQSLPHISVTSIVESSKGDLWVSTYGGGISRLTNLDNPQDIKFQHFYEGNGLLSNVVYGLLTDQANHLWMSTALGINRFDLETEKFIGYGYEDGISNSYFNAGAYHKTSDNKIYFGSTQLVNLVDYQELEQTPANQPILNSLLFLSSGKKINVHGNNVEKIEVDHDDNGFFLSFSNLDYTSSKRTEYSYLIKGFSEKWISLGDKSDTLISSLPPGDYSVSIRSRTNGSDWLVNNNVLSIDIQPPFWMTLWFKLLLAFVLISILYTYYQLRFVAIREQNNKLQSEIDSRQKLEQSLLLNKLAINSASNGISIVEYENDEFVILECNSAFASIFRTDKNNILSQSLESIILATFNKRIATTDINRAAGQQQYEFESSLKYPNGVRVILKMSLSRIPNAGDVKQFMLVVDDVTNIRKRARENFLIAKRRLMEQEAIIKLATSIASKDFSFDEAAKYVTKVVTRILGVERASIWIYSPNKKSIVCVYLYLRQQNKYQSNMELKQSDFPNYFEALRSERVIEASDIEKHPATSEFTELYSRPNNIKSLLDAPINVIDGVLGVVCIEQTKQLKNWKDDEINFAKELADQMAKVWLKQESDSLTQQLVQSQKMKTIGTMASGVAHDFNNILTPILGSVELINKDPSSDKTAKRIERIGKAANRAKDIVQQMLDLSRTSRLSEKEEIVVEKVIEESVDFVKVSASEKIEFVVDNQSNLLVYGNTTKFNQLLVNLLINAVHAVADRGRIKIISKQIYDGKKELVLITIEDDGCGMSSEFAKTIFEPFVSTKVKGLGTGLGLSVALSIVSEMLGTIEVSSQKEVGTQFTITLPSYKKDG